MPKYLGIDTSNYTTSAAVFDTESKGINNFGRLLPVSEGAKGLRQSDAVFLHIKALPEILDSALANTDGIFAVGVSSKPRDLEDSYMPCFLSGVTAASAIGSALKCNVHRFSHQRGHILAALYSAGRLELIHEPFLAFHVSGGTTDAVLVEPHEELIVSCTPAITTLDLNAGQLVDRVGVLLGLKFPAGPELEKLALKCEKPKRVKPVLKNGCCALSGVENQCQKMINDRVDHSTIARYVLDHIAACLCEMTRYLIEHYGELPIVFAGGVMSNSIIKATLSGKFNCIFSKPEFSKDNAAGIAVLTALKEGFVV